MQVPEFQARVARSCAALTSQQERAVVLRWTRGDERARDELVVTNQRLVLQVALRYRTFDVALADLVQEGNLGLCYALTKFDPARGNRFTTYAVHWVRAFIAERVRVDGSIVRRPTSKGDNGKRLRQYAPADASLDVAIADDDDELRIDRLEDEAPDAEASSTDLDEARRVRAAMHVLDARERDIVQRRYLAAEPWTLQRLAYRHHLSRERVRQLETRALKKLKRRLAA